MIKVHRRGLIVLTAFIAAFALALDVRLGLAAVAVATVIDWLFLVAPFWGSARR